jgi:hypothetical protein
MVLRLGAIGQRAMPAAAQLKLGSLFREVITTIDERVATAWSRQCQGSTPLYDRKSPPIVRLVTGLADGADQFAAQGFLETITPCPVDPNSRTRDESVRVGHELAGQ